MVSDAFLYFEMSLVDNGLYDNGGVVCVYVDNHFFFGSVYVLQQIVGEMAS